MKFPPLPTDKNPPPKRLLDLFRYSQRALELVWSTSAKLTIVFALLTLLVGVLPAAVAWIGKLIVDGVVAAIDLHQQTGTADTSAIMFYVICEAGIVSVIAGGQRGISTCQALLRGLMGQKNKPDDPRKSATTQSQPV